MRCAGSKGLGQRSLPRAYSPCASAVSVSFTSIPRSLAIFSKNSIVPSDRVGPGLAVKLSEDDFQPSSQAAFT
jgi:hypothetical protein